MRETSPRIYLGMQRWKMRGHHPPAVFGLKPVSGVQSLRSRRPKQSPAPGSPPPSSLPSALEWHLALDHLTDEAAQAPGVRAQPYCSLCRTS